MNIEKGAERLFSKSPSDGVKSISQSLTNPLGDIHDIVSDIVAVAQTPLYGWMRKSARIKVCRTNIGHHMSTPELLSHILPAFHVGFLIDGIEESSDGGYGHGDIQISETWGRYCRSVPVRKNESDSLVIERLRCINDQYANHAPYSIFGYNCGGYTRDVLWTAGLGFPSFPNWGIGSVFKFDGDAAGLRNAHAYCENHLLQLKEMIWRLDQGELLSESKAEILSKRIRVMENRPGHESKDNFIYLSHDALLQLIISAARGKNEENRIKIKSMIATDWFADDYYDDSDKILKKNKKSLNEIIKYLQPEGLVWLSQNYSGVYRLYLDLAPPSKESKQIQIRKV